MSTVPVRGERERGVSGEDEERGRKMKRDGMQAGGQDEEDGKKGTIAKMKQ